MRFALCSTPLSGLCTSTPFIFITRLGRQALSSFLILQVLRHETPTQGPTADWWERLDSTQAVKLQTRLWAITQSGSKVLAYDPSEPLFWEAAMGHALCQCLKVLVTHSCSTLCDPVTVARQAPLSREFSRGSSQPRNQIRVSCISSGLFTRWAIRETLCPGLPCGNLLTFTEV